MTINTALKVLNSITPARCRNCFLRRQCVRTGGFLCINAYYKLRDHLIPLKVEDEDGICFTCPSCGEEGYKWIEYSCIQNGMTHIEPTIVNFCDKCGQKLLWE